MDLANEELKRISEAKDSWYEKQTALETIRYSFNIFRRLMKGDYKILEVGPAEGSMTGQLLGAGYDLEALKRAPERAELLCKKFPELTVHVALFDYFGGNWMKPISDNQIEEQRTPVMLEAFMLLGERHPEIAA